MSQVAAAGVDQVAARPREDACAETFMDLRRRDGFQGDRRCLGGIRPVPELPIEKLWRNQRSHRITESPIEVLRTALAKLLRGRMV